MANLERSLSVRYVREASHSDFAYKKRQLYVSTETPDPRPPTPLEKSKIFIDIFGKDIPHSHVFNI